MYRECCPGEPGVRRWFSFLTSGKSWAGLPWGTVPPGQAGSLLVSEGASQVARSPVSSRPVTSSPWSPRVGADQPRSVSAPHAKVLAEPPGPSGRRHHPATRSACFSLGRGALAAIRCKAVASSTSVIDRLPPARAFPPVVKSFTPSPGHRDANGSTLGVPRARGAPARRARGKHPARDSGPAARSHDLPRVRHAP